MFASTMHIPLFHSPKGHSVLNAQSVEIMFLAAFIFTVIE